MMKKIAIAAGFLFACLLGWSQNDPEIVVWECQGKVSYIASDGTKPVKLKSGMVIPRSGSIQVKPNARVQLLDKSKMIQFNTAGQMTFEQEFENSKATEITGLAGRFFEMVHNVLVLNPPPIADNGRKGMGTSSPPATSSEGKKGMGSGTANPPPTSSEGKKGMGTKNKRASVFPLKGKLTPQVVKFAWLPDAASATKWAFQITQPQLLNPLVELETLETTVQQNLGGDQFKIGETYTWTVHAAADPSREVANYTFKIESANEEAAALGQLNGIAEYQNANALQKILMEAYVLEQAGFVYRANEWYDKALKMSPNDLLVLKLYYAFWLRQL